MADSSSEQSSVTLYAYAKPQERASSSVFCQKLETYLRFASVSYIQKDTLPFRTPKGKLPCIDDGRGEHVADSHFIIRHMISNGICKDLNTTAGLSKAQIAEGNAFRLAWEEMVYHATVYQRWLVPENYPVIVRENFESIPILMRPALANFVYYRIKSSLTSQGVGRHSPQEVQDILSEAYTDLAARLEANQGGEWFFGEQGPAEIDAVLFGTLSSAMATQANPFVKDLILSSSVLRRYISRIARLYFPEYKPLLSDLAAAEDQAHNISA